MLNRHDVRRILVTGATGFVGRHLVPLLESRLPDAIIVTPRLDLRDPISVERAVSDATPDICIHLAGIAAPQAAHAAPDAAWDINLHGTLRLAKALAATMPGGLLLFASSADAYGSSFLTFGAALDETAPLAPLNTYGATKAAADLALGAWDTNALHVVRMRPFNHTGKGQSPAFVVPAFARQVARIEAGLQEPMIKVGALAPLRDFLDVNDVCAAYLRCVERADAIPPNVIMNLASGTPRRIGDILESLLELSSASIGVEIDPSRLRLSDIPAASGDSAVARRLLDWEPRIAWSETVFTVLQDWRLRVLTDPEA